jgi:hypothetical protein
MPVGSDLEHRRKREGNSGWPAFLQRCMKPPSNPDHAMMTTMMKEAHVHDLGARLGIHPQAAPHPWESSSLPLSPSLTKYLGPLSLIKTGPNKEKSPRVIFPVPRKIKPVQCALVTSRVTCFSLNRTRSLARSRARPAQSRTRQVLSA